MCLTHQHRGKLKGVPCGNPQFGYLPSRHADPNQGREVRQRGDRLVESTLPFDRTEMGIPTSSTMAGIRKTSMRRNGRMRGQESLRELA